MMLLSQDLVVIVMIVLRVTNANVPILRMMHPMRKKMRRKIS